MSKKDNKNKWQWYYHFHIWQIVPDVFKFGLKGAWQKQDKAGKIFIIIFLVFSKKKIDVFAQYEII